LAKESQRDKLIDYFPLLAYFGFWLQGAAISSIITGDYKLMLLGLVTLPALAALGLAARKIARHGGETEE
jgi:hypothetical protein